MWRQKALGIRVSGSLQLAFSSARGIVVVLIYKNNKRERSPFPSAHTWTRHVKTHFRWCGLWTPFLSSRLRIGHGKNKSGGLLSVKENVSGGWPCCTLILAWQPPEQGKTCFRHLSPTIHGIYYESLGWLIQHFQQNRVFLIQPGGIMWTLWRSPFIHIIRFRKPQ